MHNSWELLSLKSNEKDWLDEHAIDRWILRVSKNGIIIPKEVAMQWLFIFISDYEVLEEYLEIDLTSVSFKLVTWKTEKILQVKPGYYGEKNRFEQVISDLKKINGDAKMSSYGHLKKIISSWTNEGTWATPPIVLDSKYFKGYKTPYHLVEGYTRLAWFYYYANNKKNNSKIELRTHHLVWLMTIK